MKILFIGGTGNISTDCAAVLAGQGHTVGVLSRGNHPLPAGYADLRGDRHNSVALASAAGGFKPDVVINFLGFVPDDVARDVEAFGSGISQYIFISSATVYAKPHTILPISEAAPVGNPFSAYAQNKQACEEWLMTCRAETGLPVTIVRPSHTYSPRWIPNPVSSAGFTFGARLRAGKPVFVHGDGESLWTLTATADFAVGLAGLVGADNAIGETYHITSDEALSWNRIYAETAAALGVDAPTIIKVPLDRIAAMDPDFAVQLKGDKAEPGVFDNTKIKQAVPGFECHTPFREGICEAVAWFDADPARQTISPGADACFDRLTQAAG
ncbi:MAG: NAD-dependent epimerase/dehydratase family protein [Verrucomicrobia bacterium]|nr:NAD-dependent epimerase/dehydratase family protein [Verrucomicrobiota bacterium]